MNDSLAFLAVCYLGVVATLYGEFHSRSWIIATGKLVAATTYLALAWWIGAAESTYGRILLLGMAFCWLGDMLLVSFRSKRLFLLGLLSFLLGHVAYTGAFASRGGSFSMMLAAGLVMTVFAWFVLRWLKPGLDARMRWPVRFYVLAICVMMTMAAATYLTDKNWVIPLGALLFLLSDLTVARDRFITQGFINRALGLPIYFGAQLTLAMSVVY